MGKEIRLLFSFLVVSMSFALYSTTNIILWQGVIASAQLIDVPLGDELYREVYDFIDRMVARQAVTRVFKNTLPYSRGEVIQILIELNRKVKQGDLKLSRVEQQRLEQFLKLFSEESQDLHHSTESVERVPILGALPRLKDEKTTHLFKTQGEKHWFAVDFGLGEDIVSRKREPTKRQTAHATLFNPTALGQIGDDFAIYSDVKVYYLGTVQFPDIPKTEARLDQPTGGTATSPLTVYDMTFKLSWFKLSFSKNNLHWGPGRHGALLISENPLPMNMVKLTAQYHPVKFQSVTASLFNRDTRKYLSSHRIELQLWDRIRLGIAESIIYSSRFETIYLNPLQIYTATEFPQRSGEANDNVLIGGDLDIILRKDLEFYGELLIDDYRPFSYSPKNWGNKVGLLFGCYYINPFLLLDTDFRIEYAFINQYAYTHDVSSNTYTHFDSIIGHQIGTDADNLWLNLRHWFTPNFTASLSYELERHGEGNVNKPHPMDAPDDDEWEFLSGVTESTHSIILSASYNLIGKYSVALEYTKFWITNVDNQDGINDTKNQVLLSGQYRF